MQGATPRRGLRWLAILLPVAVIAGVELVADWVLDPFLPFPLDTAVVTLAALAIIGVMVVVVSRRIDLLSGALELRTGELERTEAQARALHQLGVTIAAAHDLDTVLRSVADRARALLAADVAFVLWPVRPDGASMAVTSGPAEAFAPPEDPTSSEPMDHLATEYRALLLAAPLRRGGETIGSLAVAARSRRSFSVEDVEILSSIANQLALAIENARLERQLRELAVRGERERIAREMHDGLAQVLGYVNTKSQAVEELLASDQTDAARAQLAELAAAARSIYVDVREAILGLSTPVTAERGLLGALEDYATRYAEASKIATRVRASAEVAGMELAPETEAHAFRIVQEALTNVRKHADARRVEVSVEARDGELRISVADDGRGFEPIEHRPTAASDAWLGYGLNAMRDRAAAIGGSLEVASGEGAGTTVTVSLPAGRTQLPERE